jgi:hypothetical protein
LIAGILLAAASFARADDASLPCTARQSHNGSALCLSLRVVGGQVAMNTFVFMPNGSYDATAIGDDFAAEAKLALERLTKPCVLVMSPEQLKRYLAAPARDQATRDVCEFTGLWTDFTNALLRWADAIGRKDEAVNVLGETGVFRPLQTLSYRTPLIWSDTNESLDAERGSVTFFIADRFDPRTDDTLKIEIRNLPDAGTQARRLADLRRWLAPLRGSAFCHDRIRESIRAFYTKIAVPVEIDQLEVKTPFILLSERPGP